MLVTIFRMCCQQTGYTLALDGSKQPNKQYLYGPSQVFGRLTFKCHRMDLLQMTKWHCDCRPLLWRSCCWCGICHADCNMASIGNIFTFSTDHQRHKKSACGRQQNKLWNILICIMQIVIHQAEEGRQCQKAGSSEGKQSPDLLLEKHSEKVFKNIC